MKTRNYDEIGVGLIRATPYPLEIIKQATAITMKKEFLHGADEISDDICRSLYKMNHTSLFEHVTFSFLIIGASRSFLAQITRHRISSFTSGSQHYQTYSDYGFTIDKEVYRDWGENIELAFAACLDTYNMLIDKGVLKEEARQVLPGGMQNNLLWTVNARSLANFLNLRLCSRNVLEMKKVASKLLRLSIDHFPELFYYVGPDCFQTGKCTQGGMSCGNQWEKPL